MLLREMFSPLGGPNTKEEPEIDWISDLKFHIDNDDKSLIDHIFPAVRKHERHHGHEDAYKFYIKPVQNCCEEYCNKYNIEDAHEKFPKEKLIDLAKRICDEQHKHIEKEHYKNHETI